MLFIVLGIGVVIMLQHVPISTITPGALDVFIRNQNHDKDSADYIADVGDDFEYCGWEL